MATERLQAATRVGGRTVLAFGWLLAMARDTGAGDAAPQFCGRLKWNRGPFGRPAES